MKHDLIFKKNYLNEAQKMTAMNIINAVEKFKLSWESYEIFGAVPGGHVQHEMKKQEARGEQDKDKISEALFMDAMAISTNVTDSVEIIFNLYSNMNKLIFFSLIDYVSAVRVDMNLTIAFLNFPVRNSFIFGRVAFRSKHGGGAYLFAPLIHDLEKGVIWDEAKQIENFLRKVEMPQFNTEIIVDSKFIESFLSVLNSQYAGLQLKRMLNKRKYKQPSGNVLVDILNSNKKLVRVLKTIRPLGTVKDNLFKIQTAADVSIVCFPGEKFSLILLINYVNSPKRTLRALLTLMETLKSMH